MGEVLKAIGLMSGTSLDGIDAAVLETDGGAVARFSRAIAIAYDAQMRALLRAAIDAAKDYAPGAPLPSVIADAERAVTQAHADAVARLNAPEATLIGFHGQTLLHRPQEGRTWQIGDGAALARLTGTDVVSDFRSADMRAGGQGAPLAPLYHAALVKETPQLALPIVVVNIGGVANVTYISDSTILAFDSGPGNAPLDDWTMRHTGKPMDQGGALAKAGRVNTAVLNAMLQDPFFERHPPKSLDRLDFGAGAVANLGAEDGAATLTAFTAASIVRAREHFLVPARSWIVCGGGRHNPQLMAELRECLDAPVLTAEDAGWRGDFVEAEAFAYLAVRSLKGLPLTLPTTTGVRQPVTGGRLHKASA
ncbi:MAG: anhydro-N-acetylmuramic acid kinase [Alphaproteobacteria bacterium]|nr:anhydro-N-acetylmuramic acid kinase [Alphaproteobacteria bacterium]